MNCISKPIDFNRLTSNGLSAKYLNLSDVSAFISVHQRLKIEFTAQFQSEKILQMVAIQQGSAS